MSSAPEPLPGVAELEARCRALFAQWGEPERLAHVEVIYNPRLRTTAGRALPRRLRIELNPRLLARCPERLDEVLAHEAAHLVVTLRKGPDHVQHGVEWRELMRVAGFPAAATHDLPVEGLRRSRSYYLHLCPDCGDRRVLTDARAARRCGCPGRVGVFRAPRTPAGRAALEEFDPPAPAG